MGKPNLIYVYKIDTYVKLCTQTQSSLVCTYVCAPGVRMHRDPAHCTGLLGGGLGALMHLGRMVALHLTERVCVCVRERE